MTRSHYPMHPYALELADRYGIVVWSEMPVYQMREHAVPQPGRAPGAAHAVRDMVNRDRNHPVGGRVEHRQREHLAPGQRLHALHHARRARLVAPARSHPPGRPRVPRLPDGRQAADLHASSTRSAINDYFGWYPGPRDSIVDRAALSAYLEPAALRLPQPGARSSPSSAPRPTGPAHPTEKGTYEFQNDFLNFHLDVFGQKAFLNGALVWILRDFRVKPGYDGGNPVPDPPYNTKGLIDETGTRKPSFEAVKQLFRGER